MKSMLWICALAAAACLFQISSGRFHRGRSILRMRRDEIEGNEETETSASTSESDEQVGRSIQRLAGSLTGRHYKTNVGPGKTTVRLGLRYVCGQMDETNGALTLHTWMLQRWTDWRLKWSDDVKESTGIDSLVLTSDSVWKPDITQYNTFEKSEVYEETNVVVSNNGSVFWVPKVTFYTLCSGDNRDSGSFNCTLTLGSWSTGSEVMPLRAWEWRGGKEAEESTIVYDSACPYAVSNLQTRIHTETYECCPDTPFQSYVATFNVRRSR